MSSTIESSSISFLTTPSLFHNTFNHPINIKLDRSNYLLRKSQIIPAIKGHNLGGFLFGTLPCPPKYQEESTRSINPDYIAWEQQDQLLLCWLLACLSEANLGHVVGCQTSHAVWTTLETLLASQSSSNIMQLQFQLQNTKKKGVSDIDDYLLKMKNIADKLAVAGEPVGEQKLVLHILGGLGVECNPFVTSILARPASISLSELTTLLTSFHIRLKQQNTKVTLDVNQPSANLATATSPKPKSAPKYHGSRQGRFQFSARARGHGGNSRNEMGRGTRPRCQVCGKLDHLAISCYYRFDRNFQPPNNH